MSDKISYRRDSLSAFRRRFSFLVASLALASSTLSIAQVKTKNDLGMAQFDTDEVTQYEELKSESKIALSRKSVSELLKVAQDYSPGLREAASGEDAAKAEVSAAKGEKLPKVTVTGQTTYTDGDMASRARATGKPSMVITAEYPVYDWGRIDANIRGREFALTTENARKRLVSNQLAIDALSSCIELNKQVKILKANEDYNAKIRRLADLLAKITEQDSGRAGEFIQTRSRLLQGESAAETIRSRVKELRIRLVKLLGENRDGLCENIGPSLMQLPSADKLVNAVDVHPEVIFFNEQYRQAKTNIDQLAALQKPQVRLQAQHAPMAPGVSNLYAQSLNLLATIPLYDGNTLKSSQLAAISRADAAVERIQLVKDRLKSELQERAQQTKTNLERAEAYIVLLQINERVINDFYIQWATLGRRTLFELLALQAEQLNLKVGYFSTLHDGMSGVAYLETQLGIIADYLPQ